MAKTRRRHTRDPYLPQAQLAGAVRYRPKYEALAEALSNAATARDQTIAATQTTARGTTAAIDAARPQIAQLYTDAGFDPARAAAPANLPSGAVDFANAAQFEQASGQHRLAVAHARAQQDLQNLALASAQGVAFGTKQAHDAYTATAYKIGQQLASLGDQQGAYVANELGDLHRKAADRAIRRRGQDIQLNLGQQRINTTLRGQDISANLGQQRIGVTMRGQDISRENSIRTNSRPRAGERGRLPGGIKPATPQQTVRARDTIEEAVGWVQRLGSSRQMTPHQIREALLQGQTLTNDKGEKLKLPKVSKDLVNVAFDVHVHGGISRPNVRALHRRGLKVRQLGYKPLAQKPAKAVFGRNPFAQQLAG